MPTWSYVGEVGTVKQSVLTELRFDPEQPHKLKSGSKAMIDWMPNDDSEKRRSINISPRRRGGRVVDRQAGQEQHGANAAAPDLDHADECQGARASHRRGRRELVAGSESASFPAIHDLLVRSAPRTGSGHSLRHAGESVSDAVVRVAADLDSSCLAVQGPPGTGKTYTGGE